MMSGGFPGRQVVANSACFANDVSRMDIPSILGPQEEAEEERKMKKKPERHREMVEGAGQE